MPSFETGCTMSATIDVFVIDPPWPNRKGGLRKERPNQNRELDYKTMSVKDIFDLLDSKIFNLASKNHCVFLWTTEKFLNVSEEEMGKRGYRLHARMIWDKTNGIAPAFTIRYCHEYLLWFYKEKMPIIKKEYRGKFKSIFTEKSREHSRKPDVAYKIICDMFGEERCYMDVFSREKRKQWLQFGDQCNFYQNSSVCEYQ